MAKREEYEALIYCEIAGVFGTQFTPFPRRYSNQDA